MSSTYKTDEKIMKRIINNNVKTVDTKDHLIFRIYYTNNKTSSLILKNNKPDLIMKHSHLIYSFKCKIGECEHQNSEYIGMTTNTLSRRLTMHKQNGAIKNHLNEYHNIPIIRDTLNDNTKVLYYNNNYTKLKISVYGHNVPR